MIKKIFFTALSWWMGLGFLHAASGMKSYTIDLPNHMLRFSLPDEIVRILSRNAIEQQFDPKDPFFNKSGYRIIAYAYYDFNGPFWVGAYGTFNMDFSIAKRKTDFEGSITTLDGLYNYIEWWRSQGPEGAVGFIAEARLNGTPVIFREMNTFGDGGIFGKEPSHSQIFSFPIDEEMFFEVHFRVKAWDAGREKTKKWKGKAEAMREVIKATIILEPKKS